MKDNLKEEVAEFIPELVHLAGIEGVERFVTFLDQVMPDGVVGLFSVPRTATGSTEALDDMEEAGEVASLGCHNRVNRLPVPAVQRKNNRNQMSALMKKVGWITICCLLLCTAQAADSVRETVPILYINGKRYENVRWGPVNSGKVAVFHNRGVTFVPLADLPTEYQELFNYTPPPDSTPPSEPAADPLDFRQRKFSHNSDPVPAPVSDPVPTVQLRPLRPLPPVSTPYSVSRSDRDWEQYSADRKVKVVYQGKLVDAVAFKQIIGFIGNPGWVEENGIRANGTLFELAEERKDIPKSAPSMVLRPNHWKKTGKVALLKNYKAETEPGVIVRFYAVELPAIADCPLYEVATEPTFEQWQKLRSGKPNISRFR